MRRTTTSGWATSHRLRRPWSRRVSSAASSCCRDVTLCGLCYTGVNSAELVSCPHPGRDGRASPEAVMLFVRCSGNGDRGIALTVEPTERTLPGASTCLPAQASLRDPQDARLGGSSTRALTWRARLAPPPLVGLLVVPDSTGRRRPAVEEDLAVAVAAALCQPRLVHASRATALPTGACCRSRTPRASGRRSRRRIPSSEAS